MLFCFKMGNVSTIRSKVVEIIFNNIYTQSKKSQKAYIDSQGTLSLYIFRESVASTYWRTLYSSEFAFDVSCLQNQDKVKKNKTKCDKKVIIDTNNKITCNI